MKLNLGSWSFFSVAALIVWLPSRLVGTLPPDEHHVGGPLCPALLCK